MTRAIIAGDLHLRYEDTNSQAVSRFEDMLLEDPPDILVLGGDIYELWRRDLFGSAWSNSDFTHTIETLIDRGTGVEYIVGNHDEYVLWHTADFQDNPLDPREDLRLTVDGTEIFVTHGHKYEPVYNAVTNDVLSYPDDWLGSVANQLWDAKPSMSGFDPLEEVASLLLGPAASFADPHAIRNQDLRQRPIHAGLARESGDAWGVYGHTHTPFIDREERVANWGSMVSDQHGYIEVDEGEVELKQV